MSLAEIEATIADFGKRARDGKLRSRTCRAARSRSPTAASMARCMSTPILNAPQSGILGMHRIEERPVVAQRRRSSPGR